jgi:hypothetical protein
MNLFARHFARTLNRTTVMGSFNPSEFDQSHCTRGISMIVLSCLRQSPKSMTTSAQKHIGDREPISRRSFTSPQALWPRLIELWLSAILAVFFFVRIVGSQTAQRVAARFFHSHLP